MPLGGLLGRAWRASASEVTVPTQSIKGRSSAIGAAGSCPACGAVLLEDQRYCLECGERRRSTSSAPLAGPAAPLRGSAASAGAPAPAQPQPAPGPSLRANNATVLAGVGVLLLAMGVGVLIGRSAGSAGRAAAPAVVSVASPTGAASASAATSEPSFKDSWPAGTSGYTVQLQTLPVSGTKVSAVEAAKAAASAKGAKNVGAVKSEDFSSLEGENYVVYSGVYRKRAEAQKALGSLKKSFPGAKVIAVSNKGGGRAAAGAKEPLPPATPNPSYSHPAPPSVVESLHKSKGQGYEQRSKKLPNVISTG
jgi:hypothetical protein